MRPDDELHRKVVDGVCLGILILSTILAGLLAIAFYHMI